MSARIYCDACGKQVGTRKDQNYWRSTLMGDVMLGSMGQVLESTGMSDTAGLPIRKADICTACMSKTQEETTL